MSADIKDDIKYVVVVFLLILAIGMSGLALWKQSHQQEIVSVDLLMLSDHARAKIHEPEKIIAFSHRMEMSVSKTAIKNHWVIIPKQAAVAGIKDVTQIVEKELNQ